MANPSSLVACTFIHRFWTVILLKRASHKKGISPCQNLLHNRKGWICWKREEGRGGGREGGGREDMELFIVQQNAITCFIYPVCPNAICEWYLCKEGHFSLPFMAPQRQDPPLHFIFFEVIWTQPLFLEKLIKGWVIYRVAFTCHRNRENYGLSKTDNPYLVRCNYFVVLSSARSVQKFAIKGEEICWQYCIAVPLVAVYPVKATSLLHC